VKARFLLEAEDDARDAARTYETARSGLGEAFLESLTRKLAAIERLPRLHSLISSPRARREVRRAVLRRFPYSIIHEVRTTEIVVLAVAHGRRRFGY
jgi:hypothetical protein